MDSQEFNKEDYRQFMNTNNLSFESDMRPFYFSLIWSWVLWFIPSIYCFLKAKCNHVKVKPNILIQQNGIFYKKHVIVDLKYVTDINSSDSFVNGGKLIFQMNDGKKLKFNLIKNPSEKACIIKHNNHDKIMNKNEGKNRIKEQFENADVTYTFGTKKEIKALNSIITDDETVMYATSGFVNGNTVLVTLTNTRVLFIDKGMIYGIKSTEIPLNMINAVSYTKGMLMGTISITNGATITEIKNVEKNTAPIMAERIKKQVKIFNNKDKQTTTPSDNIEESLRKLKSLLDDSIITQEEFDAKKKQILNL